MISDKLKLDEIDRKIISLLQEKPNLTHTEIAKNVNRSQPTIGMRVKKLKASGVFKVQAGVNLKNIELFAAIASISTETPEKVMKIAQICPFMINCFKITGEYNILLLLASNKLEDLDAIINNHFRSKDSAEKVKMELIIDVAKDFIMVIDFITQETHDPTDPDKCGPNCRHCKEIL